MIILAPNAFLFNLSFILKYEVKNHYDFLLILCLLVASADHICNSLDPDQARQNVGHAVLHSDYIPERVVKKNLIFEKNQQMTKKHAKLPIRQVFSKVTHILT